MLTMGESRVPDRWVFAVLLLQLSWKWIYIKSWRKVTLLGLCDLSVTCSAPAPPAAGAWLSDEEPATEIPVQLWQGAPWPADPSPCGLRGASLEEQSHGSLDPRNAPFLSLCTPAARLHRDGHLRPGPWNAKPLSPEDAFWGPVKRGAILEGEVRHW